MRILIVGSLILVAWLGFGAYWNTCQIRCLCGEDSGSGQNIASGKVDISGLADANTDKHLVKTEDRVTRRPWSIEDQEGNTLMKFPASPRFKHASSELNFDPGAESLPDSIYNYLLRNPEHFVEVTGFISGNEAKGSVSGSLAAERAQALKDLLVANGVNEDRILIAASESGSMAEENGDLLNGIGVKVMHMSEEMEEEVDKHIAQKVLYCEFNEIEFNPDPKLIEYASELGSYIERHPGETIYITGHTDDEGSSGANMWVGKKRARTVRDYFVSQGVPKKKMKISTKGEHAPVADNSTEEGQALNRRIEVVIE